MEKTVEEQKEKEETNRQRDNLRNKPRSENKREIPLTTEQIAFLEKRRRLRQAEQAKEVEENYVPMDLFNSQPPLGIFSQKSMEQKTATPPPIELTTWKKCREREMKILSSPVPKNFLDEMAVKTEMGILWKFPINNEQGIDEEKVRIKSIF